MGVSFIDYGQVPSCSPKIRSPYKTYTRIFRPERDNNFIKSSEKWIPARFLNTQKDHSYRPGSVALVGIRRSTGKWAIIKVKEGLRAS